MSSRDRSRRGGSRWNDGDDMEISDDESKARHNPHSLRDGILFNQPNYYQFLIKWTSEMTSKNPGRPKILVEKITPATDLERARIQLPDHEKANVLHCDITIKSLPPSVFYGSGYGPERKSAYFAAAKDLMDKCLKMGLITRDLHEAIGSHPSLEQNRRLPDFQRAIEVVVTLDVTICQATWRDNVETKRQLSQMDFTILDSLLAEAREGIYGVNAPVYDSSFCGLCKRKTHLDSCPYGMEEKRLAKLRREQEEREREAAARRSGGGDRRRSRSRERGREQKEMERMEIERKIMAQRQALMKEDEDRKLKEATERARAAALAFGGGGLPVMGGPGAAPLVTPGLSGSANPIGMMMGGGGPYMQPQPFPMGGGGYGGGPSAEMAASMQAQLAAAAHMGMGGGVGMQPMQHMQQQQMGRGGGGGPGPMPRDFGLPHQQQNHHLQQQQHPHHLQQQQREPVSIPNGYAAHVAELENSRVRAAAEDMMRAKEREEEERRQKQEAALRAELEARLHEEIEQKRRDLEEELKQRLVPREARRLGADMSAAMSAYGVLPPTAAAAAPAAVTPPLQPMNPYGGMQQQQMGMNPYGMQQPHQQQVYGAPSVMGGGAGNGFGAPPNPYAAAAGVMNPMQPMQQMQQPHHGMQQMQQTPQELPEFTEIKRLVTDNADTLKNLAFARDSSLATHPVLSRVATLDANAMDQGELRKLRDELKDFLAMLQRKVEDGRKRPEEKKEERREDRRDRGRERDDERRRRRSRSRSRDRRDGRRDRHRGDREDKKEVVDMEEEEVIVQVGTSRFRQLRPKEAAVLKKDDVVVAQDLKSGRWSTAKVLRVSDKRVQLVVGNAQWKKEFNEVYRPI